MSYFSGMTLLVQFYKLVAHGMHVYFVKDSITQGTAQVFVDI